MLTSGYWSWNWWLESETSDHYSISFKLNGSRHWSRKNIQWKSWSFTFLPFSLPRIYYNVADFLTYNHDVESRIKEEQQVNKCSATNFWQNEKGEKKKVRLNIFLRWKKVIWNWACNVKLNISLFFFVILSSRRDIYDESKYRSLCTIVFIGHYCLRHFNRVTAPYFSRKYRDSFIGGKPIHSSYK